MILGIIQFQCIDTIYVNVFHFDINIGINLFLLPDDSYFHVLDSFLCYINLLLSVSLYFSVLEICIISICKS